jgi:protein-S-isoprenylcysteine O-methyltransferase Ste14
MGITTRGLIALTIELGGVGLVIGVRVLIARHNTGSSGVRLGGFGRAPAERLALTWGAIAIAALMVATFGALGGQQWASASWPTVGYGVLVAGAGILMTFVCQLAMGASWRIGLDRNERTTLVTAGPYRHVRNPIYTGMIVFVIGIALILPGPLTFGAVAALTAALEISVRRVEEPYLLESHGGEYARWSARAGRFVPGIGRT